MEPRCKTQPYTFFCSLLILCRAVWADREHGGGLPLLKGFEPALKGGAGKSEREGEIKGLGNLLFFRWGKANAGTPPRVCVPTS